MSSTQTAIPPATASASEHAPVRAALLGGGLFATNAYLPSLVNVPGLAVTDVWSRSEVSVTQLGEKAAALGGLPNVDKELAVRYGVEGLNAILANPDIKAVIIVLPIGAQPDLIRTAWQAGKHVISEKPLGRDVKEATELVEEYEATYAPKGIIWRVAENWAHEPFLHYAASVLRDPIFGPVLYWRMHFETFLPIGTSYHATPWRTIPDYQGGFLLDGGVHWAALLRTVLPPSARPASLTAHKSLHRALILPHDTLVGLAHPAPSSTVAPHGPTPSPGPDGRRPPTENGQSTPHGTFMLSWATPDTPRGGRVPNELYVVCAHGTLRVVNDGRSWTVSTQAGDGSGVEGETKEGPVTGVEVELADFARAVAVKISGNQDNMPNYGEPRAALWDLAFIQAALLSDGKVVVIKDVK